MILFVLLIVAVALAAIYGLILDGRRFAHEQQDLARTEEEITRNWESPTQFVKAMITGKDPLPPDGLVRARLHDTHELFVSHCPLRLADLADLTAQQAELSWTFYFPKFALLGLIVMGVGTTFFNLSHTLGHTRLDDVIVNGQFDDQRYQNAVQGITGGFEQAFVASIVAIAGTATLLLIQNVHTNPRKNAFFSRLDHFTQVRLIPYFHEHEQHSTREEALLSVTQKLEGVTIEFVRLAQATRHGATEADQAAKRLEQYGAQMGKAIAGFASAIGDNSQFHATIEQLHAAVSSSETRHRELLGFFQETTRHVQGQNLALANTHALLADFQETVKQSQTEFLAGVTKLTASAEEKIADHHRQTAEQTRDYFQRTNENTDHVARLVKELGQTTEALRNRVNDDQARYATLVEDCAAVLEKIGRSVEHFREKLKEFESPNLQILARLEHLRALDQLGPTLEAIRTGLRREAQVWSGRARQHQAAQETRLQEIATASASALSQIGGSIAALETQVSGLAAASLQMGEGMASLQSLPQVVPLLRHVVSDLCHTLSDLQQAGADLGLNYVAHYSAEDDAELFAVDGAPDAPTAYAGTDDDEFAAGREPEDASPNPAYPA